MSIIKTSVSKYVEYGVGAMVGLRDGCDEGT